MNERENTYSSWYLLLLELIYILLPLRYKGHEWNASLSMSWDLGMGLLNSCKGNLCVGWCASLPSKPSLCFPVQREMFPQVKQGCSSAGATSCFGWAAVGAGLCAGFRMRAVQVTPWGFSWCWAGFALRQGLLSPSHCPGREERGHSQPRGYSRALGIVLSWEGRAQELPGHYSISGEWLSFAQLVCLGVYFSPSFLFFSLFLFKFFIAISYSISAIKLFCSNSWFFLLFPLLFSPPSPWWGVSRCLCGIWGASGV